MTQEENLAAASLVVAFTALLIAASQLLHSIFASVEGYRRCAPSVLGAWARLRRRKWNWTELRYEVEYATPHFMLVSETTWTMAHIPKIGPAYDLTNIIHSAKNLHRDVSIYHRIVAGFRKTLSSPYRKPHDAFVDVLFDSICDGDDARVDGARPSTQVQNEDPEKPATRKEVDNSRTVVPRNEIRASWLQLLQAVQRTYSAYGHDESQRRQKPIVAIRQWNWDFMPSDLIKPLATSTLDNVILLALHLKMKWRRLDFDNGVFLADGNGFAITSTEMRGLGIVFTFADIGRHDSSHFIAPSEAVDKTMFGIVPGCEKLVQKDFYLVKETGKFNYKALFKELGQHWKGIEDLRAESIEPCGEAITLFSDFIPFTGYPNLLNCLPELQMEGRNLGHPSFHEKFNLYEMVHFRAKEIIEQRPESELSHADKTIIEAKNKMYLLCEVYDLILRRTSMNTDKDVLEFVLQRRLVVCKEIFGWTTSWFQGNQNGIKDSSGNAINWSAKHRATSLYFQLVVAHCTMIRKANWRLGPDRYEPSERRKAFDDIMFGDETNEDIYQNCSIVAQMQYIGCDLPARDIEMAWWVLMVRGMANGAPHFWEEAPANMEDFVPSRFWDIKTPVWIA